MYECRDTYEWRNIPGEGHVRVEGVSAGVSVLPKET